jgi:serine/threonine-protein kinase RsbW
MEHSLQIGCNNVNLKRVRTFVETTLGAYQVPGVETDWIVLAIDELCTNLMAHAHPHDHAHQIEVRIICAANGLTFEVRDPAPDDFDLLAYHLPDPQHIFRERRGGGLGLVLVRKIMDEVRAERQNGELVYQMRKHAAQCRMPDGVSTPSGT